VAHWRHLFVRKSFLKFLKLWNRPSLRPPTHTMLTRIASASRTLRACLARGGGGRSSRLPVVKACTRGGLLSQLPACELAYVCVCVCVLVNACTRARCRACRSLLVVRDPLGRLVSGWQCQPAARGRPTLEVASSASSPHAA
jgi:hypothetical protein